MISPLVRAACSLRRADTYGRPEAAGAILVLQATFTDPAGSDAFWKALVPLFVLVESAPGFIRRYGFGHGPHNTLIAFWHPGGAAAVPGVRHRTSRRLPDGVRAAFGVVAGALVLELAGGAHDLGAERP
jgi:hypothetical protein